MKVKRYILTVNEKFMYNVLTFWYFVYMTLTYIQFLKLYIHLWHSKPRCKTYEYVCSDLFSSYMNYLLPWTFLVRRVLLKLTSAFNPIKSALTLREKCSPMFCRRISYWNNLLNQILANLLFYREILSLFRNVANLNLSAIKKNFDSILTCKIIIL